MPHKNCYLFNLGFPIYQAMQFYIVENVPLLGYKIAQSAI